MTLMQHLMCPKQGADSPSRRSSLQEWGSHTGSTEGGRGEQLLWPICVIAVRGKSKNLEERGLRQNWRLHITRQSFSFLQHKPKYDLAPYS